VDRLELPDSTQGYRDQQPREMKVVMGAQMNQFRSQLTNARMQKDTPSDSPRAPAALMATLLQDSESRPEQLLAFLIAYCEGSHTGG
jgi:hypothetical protein